MRNKKLIVLGVLSFGIYKCYKKGLKVLETQPVAVVFDHTETQENHPFRKGLRVVARALPYAGFCEISGCKTEVHANMPSEFSRAMSAHLDKGH